MSKQITTADKAACRYIIENYTRGRGTAIATAGPLTPAIAANLRVKRLSAGDPEGAVDGAFQEIAGLGVKYGEEAIRLGIAAISAVGGGQQTQTNPPRPAAPPDDC